MRYIQLTDLQARLANEYSGLYANSTSQPAADLAAQDIAQAEDIVDATLGARYGAPLTGAIPSLIKAITLDLTLYYAWQRHPAGIPEKISELRKAAMDILDKASTGRYSIPGLAEAGTGGTGSAIDLELSANEPQFTRSKLAGW